MDIIDTKVGVSVHIKGQKKKKKVGRNWCSLIFIALSYKKNSRLLKQPKRTIFTFLAQKVSTESLLGIICG